MEKIILEEPIKVDGVLVKEISLRRPKVRDLVTASKGGDDSEKEVRLISNLSSIPLECVEEMDLKDYMRLQKVLNDFLAVEVSVR